jgi:hypothetical protein
VVLLINKCIFSVWNLEFYHNLLCDIVEFDTSEVGLRLLSKCWSFTAFYSV